jgi:hypothetical protein
MLAEVSFLLSCDSLAAVTAVWAGTLAGNCFAALHLLSQDCLQFNLAAEFGQLQPLCFVWQLFFIEASSVHR